MEEIIFNIGIIDDDSSKITQIMTKLIEGLNKAKPEKISKYSIYKLNPIELKLSTEIEDVVQQVIENKLDCVLVDYKLSSYSTIDYTGIEFAKMLMERLHDFPIFILTSHEDDLFRNEIFNAYQVFDFSRYLNEDAERIELNFKIIEQILKNRNQKKLWEEEMKKLLPLAGKNNEIDGRILELDSYIERSINGKYKIPDKIKKDLQTDKLTELLKKIDILIEDES